MKSDLNQKSVKTSDNEAKARDEWAEENEIPTPKRQRPPVHYDVGRQAYWIPNSRLEWIAVNETSLSRLLRAHGFSRKNAEGRCLSPLEECINEIQHNFDVGYAGPLAGHSKGLMEMSGKRVLVTDSFKLIQAQQQPYPLLGGLMERMFGEEQLPFVRGWLKVGYESLTQGRKRPGQVLVLAGPRDSYKSLFQNLVTEILGGRCAKPYRYMTGGTDFNSDLFGAEHLVIEDENVSCDIRARRHFGARIKDFTVNEGHSCHAKGRTALTLKPFWRVTVSVNDEPENLMILPPLDESLLDKMIILKISEQEALMPTFTTEQRKEFWEALINELPGLLWDLLHWEIPAEMLSRRFGVSHYHHPELLQSLNESSQEMKLLALIDDAFERGPFVKEAGFDGTAEKLQSELLFSHRFEAQRLFTWSGAAGTFLGRLAKQRPDRVRENRTASQRAWRIEPPGVSIHPPQVLPQARTSTELTETVPVRINKFSNESVASSDGLPTTSVSPLVAVHSVPHNRCAPFTTETATGGEGPTAEGNQPSTSQPIVGRSEQPEDQKS